MKATCYKSFICFTGSRTELSTVRYQQHESVNVKNAEGKCTTFIFKKLWENFSK
jgi:hypothetical protein